MGNVADHWFLQSMAVHAGHQGREIASKLAWRQLEELVDADRAECYLDSSPPGRKLYEGAEFVPKADFSQLGSCTYRLP